MACMHDAMELDTLNIGLSSNDRSLAGYMGGYMFKMFLYGVYAVLFSFCVYILRKNKSTVQWPFFLAAVVMFVLASADTAITLHFVFRYMLRGQMTPWRYVYPVYLLFVTNNVIADSLILYRCYMVWGRRKSIIAGPCLLLLVSTVCGYVFNAASSPNLRKLQPVYLWMTFALNISVTLLTASRILWFAHTARAILGPEMARRYYSITVIVVESGAIYSLYVLLDLVVATIVLDAALIQVVGIVPTLIIVQVGLGRVVQDVETTINFHRTEVRSSDTPVLDSIFSTTSAAPQTAQHTRTSFNDHHTTQITQVPSRPEGNHHV